MSFTYFKTYTPLIVFAVSVLLFSSCEKDEIPIAPHPPGNVQTKQVEMGPYYPAQIWFNIESGTTVSQNRKTDWDLAFECNNPGWRVTINSATFAFASATGKTNISDVMDTIGSNWKYDVPSGNLDSTAIGDWRVQPQIYILDRGKNEKGKSLGFSKLMIDSVNADSFYFRFAKLTDNVWTTAAIKKDSDYIFSYFSLNGGGQQVTVAPPKTDWDIVFTQYTHVFVNPPQTYLVTGVLLNPYRTFSAKCFDKKFAEINIDDVPRYEFNNRVNNIGYDWKYYDFNEGYYITLTQKNYMFRSQSGKMFKLHFLDFYNDKGEKGSPTFEFSEL